MRKRKRYKKSDRKQSTLITEYILLAIAILNLIEVILEIVKVLIE